MKDMRKEAEFRGSHDKTYGNGYRHSWQEEAEQGKRENILKQYYGEWVFTEWILRFKDVCV